jgi:hypothetical protein
MMLLGGNVMLASATAIWVIVIVAVCSLAFLLTAVMLAARQPYFTNSRRPPLTGPVVGGVHLAAGGRSVAPNRDAPMVFTEEEASELRQAAGQPDRASQPGATRPQVPVQPLPAARTPSEGLPAQPAQQAPALPGQRAADADKPTAHRQRENGEGA